MRGRSWEWGLVLGAAVVACGSEQDRRPLIAGAAPPDTTVAAVAPVGDTADTAAVPSGRAEAAAPASARPPLETACGSFLAAVEGGRPFRETFVSRDRQASPGGSYRWRYAGGTLSGELTGGQGLGGRTVALRDVRFTSETGSVSFAYESGGVRYEYTLTAVCDELRGRARLFMTDENPAGTVVEVLLRPATRD